ncbi:unnamed protein product [Malus baccata var. baccata]|uniref:Uncharacterized protein n=1 Tax=Malus domestica TaxID=3750 RepID=A0A498JFL8_MALDO|nr:hypothetical protein DVH24_024323 [Malus domestica]
METNFQKCFGGLKIQELHEFPKLFGSCMSLRTVSERGVEYFDLSRSNLSGRIPNYLERFKLQNLNLSLQF